MHTDSSDTTWDFSIQKEVKLALSDNASIKMLRQAFELMLALIHLQEMHKKIYDSKRPYTIKRLGYDNIYNIGYREAGNKTSNLLSNRIMTYMVLFIIQK
jgi:hypothetical protein